MTNRALVMVLALALPVVVFAQDNMMSAPAASGADAMMRAPAASTGRKVIYTTLKAAQALAAKGPTVLMFAADWCPVCQADLKEINAEGSRLGNITVVVVDFDKAADLKARYGVTYQHTYVRIDAMGRNVAMWSGGGVEGILSHVDRM